MSTFLDNISIYMFFFLRNYANGRFTKMKDCKVLLTHKNHIGTFQYFMNACER